MNWYAFKVIQQIMMNQIKQCHLEARVDPGAIVLKGYSIFPEAPPVLEPYHQIV